MSQTQFRKDLFGNDGADKELRNDILPSIQSSLYVGKMDFTPLRPDELSKIPGWYHMNGDLALKTSPQGMSLLSLSENFRNDWGIVLVGDYVSLPDWYDAEDGRGFFMRAGAVPGVIQQDMIRNIAGVTKNETRRAKATPNNSDSPLYGVVLYGDTALYGVTTSDFNIEYMAIDASRSVRTGPENRPVNRSLTPIMNLGC
jgi:hypothetical protein